jgi:phospholipase/carboxylesterase
MNRRRFLGSAAMGVLGLASTRSADARTRSQEPFKHGESRLGISDDERDGMYYVPKNYKPGVPMPIMMMLHGFAGSAEDARRLYQLAEEFGVILLAPESRGVGWGKLAPGFDDDVRYLGPAYRHVAGLVDIDREHVALAGVSDGAGYALSMGLAYGNSFNHVIVFAGGQMKPFRYQGKPKLFFAHGVDDAQMPIELTARKYVPQLKADGYDVTYREYQGGHRVPPAQIREAFAWFVGKTRNFGAQEVSA